MLPRNYSEVDIIDIFQRVNNLFENYLSNREDVLMKNCRTSSAC